MNQSGDLLQLIADFISKNPSVIILVFIISFVANFIQVSTYLRDRRKLKHEEAEKQRLAKLVDTYEDVLQIAKETVADKEKLLILKNEIQETSSKAMELSERVEYLQNIAQQKLVSQAIEYNLGVLEESYSEITRLRQQYRDLGELPDIPPSTRNAIEGEVQLAIEKPYNLPREFLFTSILLVLLIILLPSPADAFFLPFLIRNIVIVIFDAIWLYPNRYVKNIFFRYYSQMILLAEIGVWWNFLRTIVSFFEPFLYRLSYILEIGLPVVAIILAIPNWRSLKAEIEENSLPKINQSILESDPPS